jgi:glycosyltransferase involved in cell wall biosynthesis
MVDGRPTVCVGIVTGLPRIDGTRLVLADLASQTVAPSEVIVVLQRGMSDTAVGPDALGGHPPLPMTVLSNSGSGLSAARNVIIDRSRADIVIFMDDDARMPKEAIERIVGASERHAGSAALTFRVDWTGEGRQRTYPPSVRRRDSVRSLTSVASIEMAVSMRALRELGVSFDERFGLGAPFATGEELILLVDILRRGGTIVFVPDVIAQHPARTSGTRGDVSMMTARGALFRRLFGSRGLVVALWFVVRNARRGTLECGLAAGLRAVVDGWRRLGSGRE